MAKGNAKRKLREQIRQNELLLRSAESEGNLFLEEIKKIKNEEDRLVSAKNVQLNLETVEIQDVLAISDFANKENRTKRSTMNRLKLLHLLTAKNNDEKRILFEIELIKSLQGFYIPKDVYDDIVLKSKTKEKGKENSYIQKALVPYFICHCFYSEIYDPSIIKLNFSEVEHDISFKLIKFYFNYNSPEGENDIYLIPVRESLIPQILKRLEKNQE